MLICELVIGKARGECLHHTSPRPGTENVGQVKILFLYIYLYILLMAVLFSNSSSMSVAVRNRVSSISPLEKNVLVNILVEFLYPIK